MRHLKENLLVRFSIVSFVILVILAVVISTMLSMRLHRDIGLLKGHGAAMTAGTVIQPTDPFSIPSLSPNPPKDRDGRREGSGRG